MPLKLQLSPHTGISYKQRTPLRCLLWLWYWKLHPRSSARPLTPTCDTMEPNLGRWAYAPLERWHFFLQSFERCCGAVGATLSNTVVPWVAAWDSLNAQLWGVNRLKMTVYPGTWWSSVESCCPSSLSWDSLDEEPKPTVATPNQTSGSHQDEL